MKKREWKKKYKEALLENPYVDKKFAEECYQAGIECHDYDDDPADAAMMEMSYWEN